MNHRLLLLLVFLASVGGRAFGHPSDVSQMRVRLSHDAVTFRLTLNLLSLSRIVVVDADHNRRITPKEIERAVPAMAAFLRKKVLVTINDADADLGDFQRYECVWPNGTTEEVTDQEASQRYVDFNFVKPWPKGVREVWMGFQFFAELGDQHVVQAIFQQEGQPEQPVDFSQTEPEYLYDTGWAAAAGAGVLPPPPVATPLKPWLWSVAAAVVLCGFFLGRTWFQRHKAGCSAR